MRAISEFSKFCESVSSEASRNRKLELARNWDFSRIRDTGTIERFTELLRYGLDPKMQFFVLLPDSEQPDDASLTFPVFQKFLLDLSIKQIDEENAARRADELGLGKWTRRLVNKSLRLGIGADALNSIIPFLAIVSETWTSPEKISLDDKLEWSSLFFELKPPCYVIPMPDGIEVMFLKLGNKIYPYSQFGFPLRNTAKFEHSLLQIFDDKLEARIYGKLSCGGSTRAVGVFSSKEHVATAEEGIFHVSHWTEFEKTYLVTDEIVSPSSDQVKFPVWNKADFAQPIPTDLTPNSTRELWLCDSSDKFYRMVVA